MEFLRSREVDAIKARLDHPVIDSDGHSVEYTPIVGEILREISGDQLADAFAMMGNRADLVRGLSLDELRRNRVHKQGWWAAPSWAAPSPAAATAPRAR